MRVEPQETGPVQVVTLGESMVAMTPERRGSLDSVDTFRKDLAGAESNVAIGLARLGHPVAWMGRLGEDPLGRYIFKRLRGEGVHVDGVIFDPDHPTGLFVKEFAPGRTNVYYYRAGSAASRMAPADLQLDRYSGARYLFLTGITPALSSTCKETVVAAIETARDRGMQVVFDPNRRLKLWSVDEAREVLDAIVPRCHIILPGLGEAQLLTGAPSAEAVAEYYLGMGAGLVVVKLGGEGAYYWSAFGCRRAGSSSRYPPTSDSLDGESRFWRGTLRRWRPRSVQRRSICWIETLTASRISGRFSIGDGSTAAVVS